MIPITIELVHFPSLCLTSFKKKFGSFFYLFLLDFFFTSIAIYCGVDMSSYWDRLSLRLIIKFCLTTVEYLICGGYSSFLMYQHLRSSLLIHKQVSSVLRLLKFCVWAKLCPHSQSFPKFIESSRSFL